MRLRRLLVSVGWEVLGIALLVVFVVLIATMPPLQVTPDPDSWLGYSVQVDAAHWGQTLDAHLQTLRSGSLGEDRRGNDVADLVLAGLASTLKLVFISLALAVPLGMAKGLWDFRSLRKRGPAVGPMLTALVQGMPDFLLAMLLQIGAAKLFQHAGIRLFPVAWNHQEPVASMVFPVICLTLLPLAMVARITSQALVTTYDQDYIRTARAKGLREVVVLFKHALVGALVQILDGMPNVLTIMFSNALIVERLFHYPGVTALLLDAASPPSFLFDMRTQLLPPDVPVLVAAGASLGLVFALLYAVLSLLRRVVDPRLRERDLG